MQTSKLPFSVPDLQERLAGLDSLFTTLSLNGNNFKHAEDTLMAQRSDIAHFCALVEYVRCFEGQHKNILRAFIEIKSIVRQNYSAITENRTDSIESFLNYLKASVLACYLYPRSPKYEPICLDILKVIAEHDFIAHWPELLDWLTSSLSEEDHDRNERVFRLLYKITKRYVFSQRSDALYAEIIEVINKTHDKLLYFAQGYLASLMAGPVPRPTTHLSTLDLTLRLFYNFISQDIHPQVEANIPNWVQVLTQVLKKEFDEAVSRQPEDSEERRGVWFACKGDAIRTVLLISTKYTEDFQEYVQSFAEDVWNNCLAFSSGGGQKDRGKILTNSIKYFKSFCASEEYFPFFRSKMNDILIQLVIPSLLMSEDELASFEDENESSVENFLESLFARAPAGNRAKEVVCEFLQVLAKFHREQLLAALSGIFQELMKSRCPENIVREIVFLDIFINSTINSYNEQGATQVNCPRDTILLVHGQMVEPFLLEFLSNCKGIKQETLGGLLCLICHFLRFQLFYKSMLDLHKVFGLFAVIFSETLALGPKAYREMLLESLGRFLNAQSFKITDTLNANVEGLTFYKRYYMNPQKIMIAFDKEGHSIVPSKNEESFAKCLEGFYKFYVSSEKNISTRSVKILKIFIERTDKMLWNKAKGPILGLLEFSFHNLISRKLVMNFSLIDNIFECFAAFTQKADAEEAQSLEKILVSCFGLFSSEYVELMSLSVQIFAIYVRKFKVDVLQNPSGVFGNLFQSCLNLENYQTQLLGTCVAYFQFLQEAIRVQPKLVERFWEDISKALAKLHEMSQLRVYYEFLDFLCLLGWASPELPKMAIIGVTAFFRGGEKDLTEGRFVFFKQILLKEFLDFLALFIERFSFNGMIQGAEKIGMLAELVGILGLEDFTLFVSRVSSQPTRSYALLMLAKALFEEYSVFVRQGLSAQFKGILNSLMENMWNRAFNFKGLSSTYEARNQEKQAFDSATHNNYSNVHRLSELPNDTKVHFEQFLRGLSLNISVDKFFLGKLEDFASRQQLKFHDVFSDQKYEKLLAKMESKGF